MNVFRGNFAGDNEVEASKNGSDSKGKPAEGAEESPFEDGLDGVRVGFVESADFRDFDIAWFDVVDDGVAERARTMPFPDWIDGIEGFFEGEFDDGKASIDGFGLAILT